LKPTRSGYSFAGMLSLDIRLTSNKFCKTGSAQGFEKRRYFTLIRVHPCNLWQK
jgi:hypothetical protein